MSEARVVQVIVTNLLTVGRGTTDDARTRASLLVAAARRLVVDATGGQEPRRTDANDPLRDRFVCCGRSTVHGHAPAWPWHAVFTMVGEGGGRLSEPQRAWKSALERVRRVRYAIWRPDDVGQIPAALRGSGRGEGAEA